MAVAGSGSRAPGAGRASGRRRPVFDPSSLKILAVSSPWLPSFELCHLACGRALRCRDLPQAASHLFTTRDVDARPGSPEAAAAWERIAAAIGTSSSRILRAHQVHGRAVLIARLNGVPYPAPGSVDADVLVSDDPSVALAVRVADCVPVLIADARLGVVAAIHAGWRGTAARAACAGVEALAGAFGSRPGDLHAAIGPSIGPAAYEVGEEVRAAFDAAGHGRLSLARWFSTGPRGRPHLDVWQANADQLTDAGVPAARIACARACTASHPEWFFSHRGQGAHAGRLVAAIRAFRPAG